MELHVAQKLFGFDSLDGLTPETIRQKYRALAKEKHPDAQGGSQEEFVALQEAMDSLLRHLEDDPNSHYLQHLSKEEILTKYYKDTKELKDNIVKYEETIDKQANTIVLVRNNVKSLIDLFERQRENIQQEFERDVRRLQQEYRPNLIQKIFFFLPRMSEQQFWDEYQHKMDAYTQKYNILNTAFFKDMLSVYGEGLNKITKDLEE